MGGYMMGSPWRAGWMRLASSRHRGIPERAAPTVDLYIRNASCFSVPLALTIPRAESRTASVNI